MKGLSEPIIQSFYAINGLKNADYLKMLTNGAVTADNDVRMFQ